MSGGNGEPAGERIAKLEANEVTHTQSVRDLWDALKSRREDDAEINRRIGKLENFQSRLSLLMTIGAAIGTAILGGLVTWVNSLIGKH